MKARVVRDKELEQYRVEKSEDAQKEAIKFSRKKAQEEIEKANKEAELKMKQAEVRTLACHALRLFHQLSCPQHAVR